MALKCNGIFKVGFYAVLTLAIQRCGAVQIKRHRDGVARDHHQLCQHYCHHQHVVLLVDHPHHPHLFQHKHVVVEELLKLLVAKVDRQLLKPVEVKDLKPSNVENT